MALCHPGAPVRSPPCGVQRTSTTATIRCPPRFFSVALDALVVSTDTVRLLLARWHIFLRTKTDKHCATSPPVTTRPCARAAKPTWRSSSTSQPRGVSPSAPCARFRSRRHVATAFAATHELIAPTLFCKRRGSCRALDFANRKTNVSCLR